MVSARLARKNRPHWRRAGPGGALARVNKVLNRDDADRFASCTLLRIDPRNGQVTGTSAGHVPVLCMFKDGGHIVRGLPGGPVLGVVPEVDCPLGTFSLVRPIRVSRGDVALPCTSAHFRTVSD